MQRLTNAFLRTAARSLAVLIVAVVAPWQSGHGQIGDTVFTVIIEGGAVYDGFGGPSRMADVGLLGDRVAAIGDLAGRRAGRRVDARGLAVVPGFIDIHSHALRLPADRSGLFLRAEAENYIRQGVTSVIGGPDGTSALPVGELLARFALEPATINFGTFVGHGTIRRAVVGNEHRAPSPEELAQMKDHVERAMLDGAFGLSTGLKYVPGVFATTEEVIALAQVAARYNGIHVSHMREEGEHLLESVRETIRIGAEGGLPTQITHHKVVGKQMWGSSAETLRLVEEARRRGVDVTIDQYPYVASSTGLTILFPAWAMEGSEDALRARLRDPESRAKIKEVLVYNLERDRGGGDAANVWIAYCAWNTMLNGKNLAQILRERGETPTLLHAAELVMELQEQGGSQGIFFAMSEHDVERILRHPQTMVASDGGIPEFGTGFPHPRNYGAFVRVLGHYVRERGILEFGEAVRKMTTFPAQRLGISDRGRLQVGAMADVVVLDPETVMDRATFQQPHQYAVGIRYVFVNGIAVLLDNDLTGARPGRSLRRN